MLSRRLLLAIAVGAGAIWHGPASAQQPELNFGIISTEASSNLKKIWDPFLADMGKGIGYKINGFYATDYAGVIEAMRFKKVDVAWFGNKSAMEAVDRAGGEVFAQSVDADGNPGYWSHLIVHADSPLKTLDDVMKCDRTLDFGNGDANSTSGFLVPSTFVFAERGIDPAKCFKTMRAAKHEANAMAVAMKQVHVATNNNESLKRLEKTAPDAAKQIRVIWTSPLIPSDPIVWRKDLDSAAKSKLYTWLLTYGRIGSVDEVTKARAVLKELGWAPLKPSSDAQLYPIRQLELNKQVLKVQGDEKLSAEEKAKQLDTLKKKQEEIAQQMGKTPHM